jgi:peptide/nickel transport system permease protein
LLQTIPMMFFISLILFFLINIVPGGPLAALSPRGRRIDPEVLERQKRLLGLDQPIYVQYAVWLVGNDWMGVDADGDGVVDTEGTRTGILRGDFGFSFQNRDPVIEIIADRLPNTIYLMAVTMGVVAVIAIPIGIISAIKQYSAFDITATTLSFMGQAIPDFWLGLILIIVFYGILDNPFTGDPLLPSGGMSTIGAEFSIWDRIRHLILPVTMGLVGWVAWYSRFLRSSMLEVINQDYIRTARAKGQTERKVLYKHAFKNAVIPLITLLALDLPYLVAGYVFVELLFSWPGMGRLFYDAATFRDYPILMAVLIISAGMILISNLIADIGYGLVDPRIRYE